VGAGREQVAAMKALDVAIKRKAFSKSDGSIFLAHEGLSFTLDRGEFVAITGPSGCGKTTLLNIISGLDQAFEGSITFSDEARAGLVYLFQTPRLLPWRTVLHNVMLAIDDPAMREEKARALLRDVGLHEFVEHFPGQLSLGMQKRAALARAFALSPTLLLMDEPFSSLDGEAAARLRELLQQFLQKQPVTTLLITHDRQEAIELANRILVFTSPPARVSNQFDVLLNEDERRDKAAISQFWQKIFGPSD